MQNTKVQHMADSVVLPDQNIQTSNNQTHNLPRLLICKGTFIRKIDIGSLFPINKIIMSQKQTVKWAAYWSEHL